ncbi:MAG: transposase [Pseudomonadota bacterium]
MPRRSRLVLPDTPMHIIQRGNNSQDCFFDDEDYASYLRWLREIAQRTQCLIHAYALLSNRVHLLLTPAHAAGVSDLMRLLGQRYVQYINRAHQRTGTLWEGRYRSCVTNEDHYVLGCYRYIELTPVRKQLAEKPEDYRWSSFHVNALGQASDLLQPHQAYRNFGATHAARANTYHALFRQPLDPHLAEEIRVATQGNYALGSPKFAAEVEKTLKIRATRGKAGRPHNNQPVNDDRTTSDKR